MIQGTKPAVSILSVYIAAEPHFEGRGKEVGVMALTPREPQGSESERKRVNSNVHAPILSVSEFDQARTNQVQA